MLTTLPTVDVWSVGCILAELLGGKPFFKGRDYVDQLNQILHFLGTPDEYTLSRIGSPRAQEYVRNLPHMPKIPFQKLFPSANPDALDLLDRMLAFDPTQRIGVEEALEHKYLQIWHDASDEPVCPTKFDFAFEVVEEIPDMRQMILDEVRRFRQEVRAPQQQNFNSNPQQQQQQQQQQHGIQQQQQHQQYSQHQQYTTDPSQQMSHQQHHQQGMVMGQNGVPIPQNYDPRAYADPRPDQTLSQGNMMNLEQELQGGLDAMR